MTSRSHTDADLQYCLPYCLPYCLLFCLLYCLQESPAWPVLVESCAARGIRMGLLNARMSSRAFLSWFQPRVSRALLRRMMASFSLVVPQSDIVSASFLWCLCLRSVCCLCITRAYHIPVSMCMWVGWVGWVGCFVSIVAVCAASIGKDILKQRNA
jgi:hypothetical protein